MKYTKYVLGLVALSAYFLLLSSFVSGNVQGGVKGGTPVRTERHGRTITTYYEGGEKVVYRANLGAGAQIRLLALGALIAGLGMGVFAVRRKESTVRELVSKSIGGGFAGLAIAFVTGMPVAVLLKSATPQSLLIYLFFLCGVVAPVFIFIGKKLSKN